MPSPKFDVESALVAARRRASAKSQMSLESRALPQGRKRGSEIVRRSTFTAVNLCLLEQDAFEERAAILEFDAHLPRGEAERFARKLVLMHRLS